MATKDLIEPDGITILGSTGSIGMNTLNVIAQHPNLFKVVALSASVSVDKLFEQCCLFKPAFAVMADEEAAKQLTAKLKAQQLKITVLSGNQGLCQIAELPEVKKVVAGIVGAAGLLPTLSAVKAGKEILLANKEALVMAGNLFFLEAKRSGAILLPVDSEHNALFQCMPAGYITGTQPEGVQRLILTASGGAFLHLPFEEFDRITPEMAICHPNWKMGKKITVDCATLMNKGLEMIEACHLFQFNTDRVDVVIHPQSIVHSFVEYSDGSLLAQLGTPDMKIPIAFCLAWPQRIHSGAKRLSLTEMGQLTFMTPDLQKFHCLSLAYEAANLGKAAPTVLNASNEVAVHTFLQGDMRFCDIPSMIEEVLHKLFDLSAETLDEIIYADHVARKETMKFIHKIGQTCLV